MKKLHADDFKTYQGVLPPFSDERSKKKRRIVWISVAAFVSVAAIFLGGTTQGRAWTAGGTAIIAKSFHDALGLSSHNAVVQEITDVAGADSAAGDTSTSSIADAVASDTSGDDGSFPLVLAPVSVKSKTSSTAKKLKNVATTKAENASGGDDAVSAGMMSVLIDASSSASSALLATGTVPSGVATVHVTPAATYSVSVVIQGDGRGMVTSTPPGISCDGIGACLWNFPTGSKITLSASHDTASSFGGWSGACSGASAACALTVGGSVSVTALFHKKTVSPMVGGTSIVATAPTVTPTVETTSSNSDALSAVVLTAPLTTVAGDLSASGSIGVAGSSSVASAGAAIGHVIIAGVQIAGDETSNDFVQLYNPTGAVVDMSGWKLHKKSSTGADYSLKSFATGTVIPAGGYFMWANSANGFSDSINADVASTQTLSADNSVALFDASGTVVDAVAWGNGVGQYVEGSSYPSDPGANQDLIRRSVNGVMVDTDNNASDFVIQG